jgi:serine/threonine protein kinase
MRFANGRHAVKQIRPVSADSRGAKQAPARIARFQILRLLGTGAQSAVYLAHDPQLDRNVAIKTLHFARPDAAQNRALLNEARTVGKLRHVNIVPIFDAGEQDGDPYLVFEYVDGRTLAQVIRTEGAMKPARAAELTLGVLDALNCAHQQGIVHRDLKPSNILIEADGRPRVMDFGIAARVSAPRDSNEDLLGTPAYMAPEYVANRTMGPQADVFAAGLILYEMVFGTRAVQAEGLFQTLHKIVNEPIVFPADARRQVDEKLFDIIAKATARDPQMRYASAQQMREALDKYLHPDTAEAAKTESSASTLEFLLRRMRHKSDFPAMSSAISTINRIALSEKENVASLSNAILKDFALTNKILRMVNSAFYRRYAGDSISTVSRAIVVLGFNTIRDLAVSLILFEHLQNKEHAAQLREDFLHANMSSIVARELAVTYVPQEAEESFICAQFHNLGRILCRYYFPEEASAIDRLISVEKCSEENAALRVLGITFQDLGIGIAKNWNFPDTIIHSMQRLPAGKVSKPTTRVERLRTLATCANEISTAVERYTGDDRKAELARIRSHFGESVPLSAKQFDNALAESVEEITELAKIVRINLKQTRFGRSLLEAPAAETATSAAPPPDSLVVPGTLSESTAAFDRPDPVPAPAASQESGSTPAEPPPPAPEEAQAILTAGIQDISRALVEDFSLGDLLRIILETMYRAMTFRRVLLCMRDGRTGIMSARFGFGADVDRAIEKFRFTMGRNQDIFNIILAKGVDVLISDATDQRVASRIPDWHRSEFSAETFIVFPLCVQNVAVAMIYADRERAGSIVISEQDLALLRTLRNQAVLAIKQARQG